MGNAKQYSSQRCRKLVEHFHVSKTTKPNILKVEEKLRIILTILSILSGECWQYHTIRARYINSLDITNKILFAWIKMVHRKTTKVFDDGTILQEKAKLIKERLDNTDFEHFSASDVWLEKWKLSYGLRENHITREAGNIHQITVKSWINASLSWLMGVTWKSMEHG